MAKLLEDKDAENIKRSTKVGKQIWKDFLLEKNVNEPSVKRDLALVLKSSYVDARKKDGSSYSLGSLKTLRFALNRHLKAVQSFEIMNDPEFSNANKVFAAKCVQIKNDGLGKVQHKSPIDDANMRKAYESAVFDTRQPQTLLNKVFCEIMLCFWRRGRQNLSHLRKSDVVVATDATGARFVTKVLDGLTK